MRTKLLAVVGAASLLLITAACGDDDDDSASIDNVADAKSDPSDTEDGDIAAEDGEDGEAESGDVVDVRAADVIGITEGSYKATPNDSTTVPVTAEITRVERNGDLVELSFNLTNDHDSAEFRPYSNFSDRPDVAEYDVSGVKLVDGDGGRVYLPPLDSEDKCLCTSEMGDTTIHPGESVPVSATFAGLPSDVTTVDVQIPGMASVDGLSISG